MANEIQVTALSGLNLSYRVDTPAGAERSASAALTEVSGKPGHYTADNDDIQDDDIIIITNDDDSDAVVGGKIYNTVSGINETELHDALDSYTNKDDWKAAGAGSGSLTVNYYVYTDEEAKTGPIADCKVWVSTDEAGTNIIASGYTNDLGKVTVNLDAGTYYFWRSKAGYTFTNPDTEVIS